MSDFYSDLYKSKSILNEHIDSYFKNICIEKTLSIEERELIEGKISYVECTKVVNSLKLNKSPGLDGLPSEFYKKFWPKLCNLIVDSFNESYDDGILCESQRKAVITLIFKKGDAELLLNYRPISVTCADYKILAFCLANRLQSVIKSIVSSSQVSYIKGRYIGCNNQLF